MAAEVEEVVISAHLLYSEHSLPYGGDARFQLVARSDKDGAQFGACLVRCWKRTAVHLPVGRARN